MPNSVSRYLNFGPHLLIPQSRVRPMRSFIAVVVIPPYRHVHARLAVIVAAVDSTLIDGFRPMVNTLFYLARATMTVVCRYYRAFESILVQYPRSYPFSPSTFL